MRRWAAPSAAAPLRWPTTGSPPAQHARGDHRAACWEFTQITDEEVRDLLRAAVTSIPARTVEPLERTALWKTGDVPETYPFAV